MFSLIGEHLAFSVHLSLQTKHQVLILGIFLLLHMSTTLLFKLELSVSTLLLGHHLGAVLVHFCLLALAQQGHVLLLHPVVGHLLILPGTFLMRLVGHLPVELLFDETFAFLLAHESLLLFFIMEERVEFLDREPLILLIDLTVDVSASAWHTRGLR